MEDGTGEAQVWFSCPLVRLLLGLADSQWEELQRALRVRGRIRVYSRGRGLVRVLYTSNTTFSAQSQCDIQRATQKVHLVCCAQVKLSMLCVNNIEYATLTKH
jgi:hypothetical protein